VGPLQGFRSRFGKSFAATLLLDEELKIKFSFNEESQQEAEELLRKAEPIVSCPLCKEGSLREGVNSYLCDRSLGAEKKCSLRIGRTILQQPIEREQLIKLVERGKTDLLSAFVSKKGRKFSAFLKLDGNKVSFEFEPRKEKTKVVSKNKNRASA
jgi:DNA topoisomerase-3